MSDDLRDLTRALFARPQPQPDPDPPDPRRGNVVPGEGNVPPRTPAAVTDAREYVAALFERAQH